MRLSNFSKIISLSVEVEICLGEQADVVLQAPQAVGLQGSHPYWLFV